MNRGVKIYKIATLGVLQIAIFALLFAKPLHLMVHDHGAHSCCSHTHQDNHGCDSEKKSEENSPSHDCSICSHIISKFVDSKATVLDFTAELIYIEYHTYQQSEDGDTPRTQNSRAPPKTITI